MDHGFKPRFLICCDCRQEFIFTPAAQAYYAERGYVDDPKRCKACHTQFKRAIRDKVVTESQDVYSEVAGSDKRKAGSTRAPTHRTPDLPPQSFGLENDPPSEEPERKPTPSAKRSLRFPSFLKDTQTRTLRIIIDGPVDSEGINELLHEFNELYSLISRGDRLLVDFQE